MNETISVIIPAYNGEKYLAEALASVTGQTNPPLEIIVVDDGSTDGTAQVTAKAGGSVRCVRQPNQGAGPARNTGVKEARGSLIAFLDADDLWTADKLEKQLAALSDDPSLEAVFGHVQQFISRELDETMQKKFHCPEQPMAGLHPGTLLIKREAFERIGFFSPAYSSGEFLEWFGRAREKGLRYRMLPDLFMQRRIHGGNSVLSQENNSAEYARIIKAALDRRRAGKKEPRDD